MSVEPASRGERRTLRLGDPARTPHQPKASKVAYYSPLPPSRSGIADYSALLLPALESGSTSSSHARAASAAPPKADVALYHVGNDPDEHGWIVDALRRRPGVVVLHEFVLHHLVSGITLARGDVEGYCAALEREAGLVGPPARPRACTTARSSRSGRRAPRTSRSPREVLDPATGPDRPLALRRGARPRRRLRRADLADADAGLAGAATSTPAADRGQPADRLLRPCEREQAHPAAARGFERLRDAVPTRGCCSSARGRRGSPSSTLARAA